MKYYIKCFKQYFDFKGRASRKEFWMFVLFQTLFTIIAMGLDDILFGYPFIGDESGPIWIIYVLLSLFPYFAVMARRLQDVGKKQNWFLLIFLPIIGHIWLLVLFLKPSQNEENKWGPIPEI